MMRASSANLAWPGPCGPGAVAGATVSTEAFALPAGTTTFLSADLGGPAPPWEAGGDETGDAMGRLGAVVSANVVRHGGVRRDGAGAGGLVRWRPSPGPRRRWAVPWTSSVS